MKHLIMQFSSPICHFLPVRSKYLPQHLVLKCPQFVFFPWCERPTFTPMQTRVVIVLYTLIFIFQSADRKTKGRPPRIYMRFTSSCMQFWFVTVVLKWTCLNFDNLSEVFISCLYTYYHFDLHPREDSMFLRNAGIYLLTSPHGVTTQKTQN
jgi:hypothetical protein